MNRTAASRSYLFSGLLVCGECTSRLVIISGRGKRGYVKYGCPSHRYRGVCDNAVTIRQDRLEQQLLAALEQRLSNPEMIEYTLIRFQEELQKRLAEIEQQTPGWRMYVVNAGYFRQRPNASRMHCRRRSLSSPPSKLGEVEAQIARLDRHVDACKPINIAATVREIRDFVSRNLINLKGLLHEDASRSKGPSRATSGNSFSNRNRRQPGPFTRSPAA